MTEERLKEIDVFVEDAVLESEAGAAALAETAKELLTEVRRLRARAMRLERGLDTIAKKEHACDTPEKSDACPVCLAQSTIVFADVDEVAKEEDSGVETKWAHPNEDTTPTGGEKK